MLQTLVVFYLIASVLTALFFWSAFGVAKRAERARYSPALWPDSETVKRTGRFPYDADEAD